MSLDIAVWIKQELNMKTIQLKLLGEICQTAPENMVNFLFDSVLRLFFVCFWIIRDPNNQLVHPVLLVTYI